MKLVRTLFVTAIPICCWGHPCPYDWNVLFTKTTKISGESYADFAKQFNEAVREETKSAVAKAIVVETKADTFTKVPEDSEFGEQMEQLFRCYRERTGPLIKKGTWQYGTAPLEIEFPGRIPVACILSGCFDGRAMRSAETKEGLMVTIQRRLECRAYRLSEKFLRIVEERKPPDLTPETQDPVQVFFARYSGMMWEVYVHTGLEEDERVSIIDGVTLHIPERRVMLALESKKGHEHLVKMMGRDGYIEGLSDVERAMIAEDDQEIDPFAPPE